MRVAAARKHRGIGYTGAISIRSVGKRGNPARNNDQDECKHRSSSSSSGSNKHNSEQIATTAVAAATDVQVIDTCIATSATARAITAITLVYVAFVAVVYVYVAIVNFLVATKCYLSCVWFCRRSRFNCALAALEQKSACKAFG